MKLATIDIGSNSIHLLIVEVDEEGHFRTVDREREMVRLGSHGLTVGHLAPDAVNRALGALGRYADLAKAHKCERVIATATSAVREADNGDKFLKRVLKRTGIAVELLSGVEEARLIALAVDYVRDLGETPTLGIDIGGGSTEFWILKGGENKLLVSNKLGSVRLSDGFVATDPISKRDAERLRGFVIGSLARTTREVAAEGFAQVVVTSGTAITLAEMAAALAAAEEDADEAGKRPPPDTVGLELTSKELRRIVKLVTRSTQREREKIPGLPAERADIIVAGAILLDTIFEEFDVRSAQTCDWSLREGVLINYLQRRFGRDRRTRDASGAAAADGIELNEIRRRSVLALARRCEYDADHARQTSRLAKSIFDQTQAVHGLGQNARELLETSAMLHEIGYAISHTSHNLHSQYLIENSELLGFSSRELAIAGMVVRYRQRSSPTSKADSHFARLRPDDKRAVRTLTAILRLAAALDRSGRSVVERLDVETRKRRTAFRVAASGDCHLELWAARRKAALFEKVFDTKTSFELAHDGASGDGRAVAAGQRQAARRR